MTNALGTTQLNANVTTSGLQTYNDNVRIDNPLTLTTTDSNVLFAGTVDSQAAEANALTVTVGAGNITFTGAVGARRRPWGRSSPTARASRGSIARSRRPAW